MLKDKYCLLTNDVETTSIWHNKLRNETGINVYKYGMPRLLDLYSKYNIKSTFYFTGYIAKLIPDIVKMIIDEENDAERGDTIIHSGAKPAGKVYGVSVFKMYNVDKEIMMYCTGHDLR